MQQLVDRTHVVIHLLVHRVQIARDVKNRFAHVRDFIGNRRTIELLLVPDYSQDLEFGRKLSAEPANGPIVPKLMACWIIHFVRVVVQHNREKEVEQHENNHEGKHSTQELGIGGWRGGGEGGRDVMRVSGDGCWTGMRCV